jgi:aspartate racemase
MQIIGLIGGLSWISTIEYYRLLNQMVNERLGGVSAAKIILYSLNFAEIKELTEAGDWNRIEELISDVARKIEDAGASCLMIGANTMHKIADEVQASINIPLIHIAEETAGEIMKHRQTTVALLGTKYTMQLDFYTKKLSAKNISTIIPNENDIEFINTAIYTEMGKGLFLPETKHRFLEIIDKLAAQGAEGAILGCTEIPLLLTQEDCPVRLYDTTRIHSRAAVEYALRELVS